MLKKSHAQQVRAWIIVSALLTLFLWQIPYGDYLLYPFTILATWFHEMGHGLTAMLLGGEFHRLMIYANGNGLAFHSGGLGFLNPLVSIGGLLGPPIAGALFILAGQSPRYTRWFLFSLALVLALSTLIWVRSLFGWISLPLMAVGIGLISLKGQPWLQEMTLQFLGVQACISTYRQVGYLFMRDISIDGQAMLSDTGQIEAYWFLPYWFWGTGIAILSFALLVGSVWWVYRQEKHNEKTLAASETDLIL